MQNCNSVAMHTTDDATGGSLRRSEGRPASSLRPQAAPRGHGGPDPRDRPGLLRVDGRLDRDAHDHRRPRRPAALLVGLLDLPADRDRDDADLWTAGGHLRPPARAADRDRGLPGGSRGLRLRPLDAAAHPGAGGAGRGRRGPRADRADGLGRPLLAQGTRADPGPLLQRVGLREPRRSADRGLDDGELRVALDLHHQHSPGADRAGARLDADGGVAGEPPGPPGRRGRDEPRGRSHRAALRRPPRARVRRPRVCPSASCCCSSPPPRSPSSCASRPGESIR